MVALSQVIAAHLSSVACWSGDLMVALSQVIAAHLSL